MATAKLLLTDLISGVNQVPSNYIRPISDRPNLTDVQVSSHGSIPLIDLQGLNGPDHSDIIKQIAQACQNDGFFQVYILFVCKYIFVKETEFFNFIIYILHSFLDYSGKKSWDTGAHDQWHVKYSKRVFQVAGEREVEDVLRWPFKDHKAFHQFQCQDWENRQLEGLSQTPLLPSRKLCPRMAH